jgi:hypothetical protein
MDAATFEDISGRLRGLLIGMEDRMPVRDVQLISEFVDAGELGLALEQIADVLSEDEMPITSAERRDMLELVDRMQMDDRVPGALRFCPGSA